MSWKSLVSVGLLCVLVSPVFAVPQLEIRSGGLNAQGDWIWNVRIAPTAFGTPVDTELGFRETTTGAQVISVANSTTTAGTPVWDTSVAGESIFGAPWEVTYNTPARPEGIEVNCSNAAGIACSASTVTSVANLPTTTPTPHHVTVVNGTLDEIFAALGSRDMIAGDLAVPAAGPALIGNANASAIPASSQYLQIITKGPSTGAGRSLSSAIQLLGAYDGVNKSGHISEITTGTNSTNYKGFTGSASIAVIPGDINLSGNVNFSDAGILSTNVNTGSGKNWNQGDINGDGIVNFSDAGILSTNVNTSGGSYSPLTKVGAVDTPGAGSGLDIGGGGSSVPEPASIALMGLAVLGSLGLFSRKR